MTEWQAICLGGFLGVALIGVLMLVDGAYRRRRAARDLRKGIRDDYR